MIRKGLVAFAVAALLSALAVAQNSRPRYTSQRGRGWTIPAGTVISMRMDSNLNSGTSRAGDRFSATVTIPVYVNGKAVIPAGAVVEGRVTSVVAAKRRSKSGSIAVDFDELIFPNGSRLRLTGTLTAADPRDRDRINDESTVSGDTGDRNVVFIGGGGAVGAIIGGIAGGGKGAVLGGVVGAGAGVAGVLLSKGVEAEVTPGTPFGINLTQAIVVTENMIAEPGAEPPAEIRPAPARIEPRPRATPSPTARPEPALPLSSPEMIRRAQIALRDKGYYEGQIDGIFGPRTSNALRTFQREHNLAETGRLDPDTARSLGILGSGGNPSPAANQSGTVRPDPVPTSVEPASGTSRPDPVPAPEETGPATGRSSTGRASYVVISRQAEDLFSEYKSSLGARSVFEESEIVLLFSLNSFATSADLYAALAASVSDAGSLRAATLVLARDARRTDRILMSAGNQPQTLVEKWDLIRQEVLRLMQTYNIQAHEIE